MRCYGRQHVFVQSSWASTTSRAGTAVDTLEPPADARCLCGAMSWQEWRVSETLVQELVDWRDGLVAKQRRRIFLDAEYTGLHQGTTLISLALVSEDGQQFYGEMDDFDLSQVDDWLEENVLSHLWIRDPGMMPLDDVTYSIGNERDVRSDLAAWLAQFGPVEMWGDCLAYDWVLFCELFGGALSIPANVYYIPFDLATLLNENGIDPDIDREEYAGRAIPGPKHNALHDALVIKACHDQVFLF